MSVDSFKEKVWRATQKIPRGKVSTYGRIAYHIGKPGAARAVGSALSQNRDHTVPCHRVVRSDGGMGGYAHGIERKIMLLKREGAIIKNSKVDQSCFFN